MPVLVSPTVRVHASFVRALEEFHASTGRRSPFADELDVDVLRVPAGFEAYVRRTVLDALEDSPRPEGWVPCTHLWWVESEEFVGRLAIRHRLTPFLTEIGGHIGYDIRPTARRRGHARAMLAASLPVAAGLGIDRALVTCDVDNDASRRVIESAGGVLEDRRGVKLRYWVPTTPGP